MTLANNSYYPSNSEDKTWALLAHVVPLVAMIASAGLLGFVAGIVLFILGKDRSPFIRNYTAQALNIQLNALIWIIVSYLLMLVIIGFFTIFVVAIWTIVLHIVAISKSSSGVLWKPPFCIQFVRGA